VSRFSIEHSTKCEPEYLILDSNKDEGLGICGCATKGDAQFVLEALNNYSVAQRRLAELEAFKSAVIGWRENDWPEGFCRGTAELIVERAKETQPTEEQS
jgi:hypothetical protein